ELLEWARSVAMQASLRATLECLKAFTTTDFRPDLPAFKVPTLIIHGTEDRTVPIDASARPTAQELGMSTLLEYKGAPHGLFATHKDQFTRDLLAFLAK
ncbi:MAG: alpha/beta hydrolase, partial [Ferruginibacter sp.]|nr:alpha/beta hydrolase [Rhodoferax sp.]